MDYVFDKNGNLQPQRVRKYEMAFFYNVTPRQFRNEIAQFMVARPKTFFYTKMEVEKIIKFLGQINKNDVLNAQERIKKYKKNIKKNYINKLNNKKL